MDKQTTASPVRYGGLNLKGEERPGENEDFLFMYIEFVRGREGVRM